MSEQLFELNRKHLEFFLTITRGDRRYRLQHNLRPPKAPDWVAYEREIHGGFEEVTTIDKESGFRPQAEAAEAANTLWDLLVLEVKGYTLTGNLGNASWKEKIPLAHKEAAIGRLAQVSLASEEEAQDTKDLFPEPGEELVLLEAEREATFPRLLHRFTTPTLAQEKVWKRLIGDNLFIRGRKGGNTRTLLAPKLRRQIELYDLLIASVEGYSYENQHLASKEQVVKEMDAWHKRMALLVLFRGEEVEPTAAPVEEVGGAA